jgi:D-cysteine desulfhydrase family pyridoxal phosphate-dependent enzyme
MKQITDFPSVPLALLPTPLYKLENLSRETGKNIYIKRDDMTGAALGGNKVRKLEFLLADARAKGADVVLTAGGPQSNHAMLTAACAAKLGMSAILVLKKRGVLSGGNLILDEIFGAEVRFVDTDSYDGVYAEMERIMADLRAQGHAPYFIPVGGSVPLGCLGYVNCAKEIANQAEDLGVDFDIIVSATGSGGTYAGLTLGAKLFLPGTVSVGIGVCDDPFEAISLDLMEGTAALLEADVPVEAADIHIHYHIGPGYAIPSPEGAAAVRRLARTEGILVDPVYTGKALAGFFQLLEEDSAFRDAENILFLHTGGAGALFAV